MPVWDPYRGRRVPDLSDILYCICCFAYHATISTSAWSGWCPPKSRPPYGREQVRRRQCCQWEIRTARVRGILIAICSMAFCTRLSWHEGPASPPKEAKNHNPILRGRRYFIYHSLLRSSPTPHLLFFYKSHPDFP